MATTLNNNGNYHIDGTGFLGLAPDSTIYALGGNDKVFGEAGQSPLAGMFRFIPMDTTNSIIVITSQPDYLKQAEQWLYRLDLGAGHLAAAHRGRVDVL